MKIRFTQGTARDRPFASRGPVSRLRFLVTAGIALVLTGCAASPHAGAAGQPPARPARPRAVLGPGGGDRGPGPAGGRSLATSAGRSPADVAHSETDGDLPIGAGDLIEVSVFEVEELSKIRLRVPLRGWVSLPLLGQIEAAGRTTAQLEDDIRDRLERRFMHDPQVSVFIHEHNSQRVSVIGAVRRGGVFTLNRQRGRGGGEGSSPPPGSSPWPMHSPWPRASPRTPTPSSMSFAGYRPAPWPRR